MNTQALRDTIALAGRHEDMTGQLEQCLQARLPRLHHAIQLPGDGDVQPLLNLVRRYIEQVPELVETTASRALQAGISDRVRPLLRLAADYFLKPTELATGRVGLDQLLDEAYLAQRLIEEAGDYSLRITGRLLIPVDMSQANLIVHHLIGEPFANELEDAVGLACGGLYVPTAQLAEVADREYLRDRPCLAEQYRISLLLPGHHGVSDRVV